MGTAELVKSGLNIITSRSSLEWGGGVGLDDLVVVSAVERVVKLLLVVDVWGQVTCDVVVVRHGVV